MAIRHIKLELEAKLTGATGGFFSRSAGKVERKSYRDKIERLKISLRGIKVPDQSIAVVTADGVEIARITLRKGAGRIDNESSDPSEIPSLHEGQTIAVHVDGNLILSGELYVD